MNDRFKFRVWDKRKNIYIKDFVFNFINKAPYITIEYFDNEYEYTHTFEEDEIIIEQCTGLRDKNGKLIYENDIVEGKATIGEGGFKYLGWVKWYYQSELIGWYIEDKDGGAWELKQAHAKISADNITGEVIGNIHENIDLLGKE